MEKEGGRVEWGGTGGMKNCRRAVRMEEGGGERRGGEKEREGRREVGI